jgi:hypothetical protein
VSTSRFFYLGQPYFTKQKNNRPGTTTTPHCSEGHGPMTRGRAMLASVRQHSPKARGHPPDRRSGLHYGRIQAAPAQILVWENETRQHPEQIESPTGPPLAAAVLIRFSTSSATLAKDATNEDDSPVSPSTKS